MTPEETKRYIEHRLNELGWNVHIGKAGYERIFRFTEGTEDGTDELCHKLLSLGALQDSREITDDVVSMAMTDLSRMDEISHRSMKGARAEGSDSDLASIEQLSAVLEAKVANGEVETEIRLPERAARSNGGAASARPASPAAALPKVLVVDASAATRAALAKALVKDCRVVEAADGEQAWKILLEQADIGLLVTDLAVPSLGGHELIKRVRAAVAPPHLVGMPIIVLTGPEAADAKLRVLMAGANDFVLKNVDPGELRARILARHRLSKMAARASVRAGEKTLRGAAPRVVPEGKSPQRAPQPKRATAPSGAKSASPRAAEIHTLRADPRFPAGASPRPRDPAHESLIQHVYRISSTTTITLSATLLLAIAILAIIYVGRGTPPSEPALEQPPATARLSESPAPGNETSPTETEKPAPSTEPAAESPAPQAAPPSAPPRPPTSGSAATPTPAPSSTPRDTASSPKVKSETDLPSKTEGNRADAVAPEPATPPPAAENRLDAARAENPSRQPPAAPARPAPTERSVAPPTTIQPSPPTEAMTGNEEIAAAERPAVTAPPAAPVPAPAPSTRISKDELASFLRRFASVYEAGDLDQFVAMFTDNARTNDRIGRKGIREDYDALFRATDLRRMKLGEISWEVEGNQAYGWGDFEVNVRRSVDQEAYAYTGSMTFVVEKQDGRLRIVRLYHGQRRAER